MQLGRLSLFLFMMMSLSKSSKYFAKTETFYILLRNFNED